jgi:cyclase
MVQDSSASLQKIGNGVYAWIGARGDSNAGAIETQDGVLVIDAQQTSQQGLEFRSVLESEIKRPIYRLINSHFHLDHTAGNVSFSDLPIVAHKCTYSILKKELGEPSETGWLVTDDQQKLRLFFGLNIQELVPPGDPAEVWFQQRMSGEAYQSIRLVPPSELFEDKFHVRSHGDCFRAEYWGAAHCDGDLVMYLDRQKIAFLGDLLFVGRFPWFGDCDLEGWIGILDRVLKLDITTVVPGHGPVTSLKEVAVFRELLHSMRDVVLKALRSGLSEDAAVAEILLPAYRNMPRYAEWMPFNVRSTYRYLKSR